MGVWKRTNKEIVELQLTWWARTNPRPLVGTFAPVAGRYGGLDFGVKPAEIVERKLANLESQDVVPGDNLRTARVDFGTAFLPALAGARAEYDGHTAWSHPCAPCAAELKIAPFDAAHPMWQEFEALFVPLLKAWSWETYLPSLAVMVGPLDVLSAMLGPETLALELMEHPDAVRQKAAEAAALFVQVYDAQRRMIADAGLTGGMADWMCTWLPDEGACYSEDFAALCGADHFRAFFVEPNARVMRHIKTAYLHLHSGALGCLPGVLDLARAGALDALEISNDPSGPSLDRLIAAARQVQAAGVPLQISNWQKPLTRQQIGQFLAELRPEGLKITLQAASLGEAEALYAWVRG